MKRGILGSCASAALVIGSAVGCSSSGPTLDVGTARSAIQGGTADTSDTFAVGIAIGGKGQQLQGICSGALIAPNLVVSARHCVDQISSSQVDCATGQFGGLMFQPDEFWVTTSSNMLQSSQGWHQVSQIITPPATAVCGNDISLLILSDNVPTSEATPITPGIAYPLTDHTHYSTTETAIGYGMTSATTQQGTLNGSGTRRIRQNIDIACIPGDAQIDCGQQDQMTANEFQAGDGTCEGDSGSSAYEQTAFNSGKPVSLGVLSRGGQSGSQCIGAIYTRLDVWKDLIISTAKTAAQAGGYAPPEWAGGGPAPVTDAGAPDAAHSDSGTSATTDGGGGSPSSTGDLGAACSANSDCTSNTCRGLGSNPYVCTQACDNQNTCPSGFACSKGFCFAGAAGSAPGATTTTTTGCAVAPGRIGDPNKPVPWRVLGLGLALGLVAVRRRRRA